MKQLLLIVFMLPFCIYSQLYTEMASVPDIDSMVQANFGSENIEIFNVKITGDTANWLNPDRMRYIGFFHSYNSIVGIDEGMILTGGFLYPPYGLGKPSSETPP